MKQIACIAVDDEPLALNLVGKFIEETSFLALAGKYKNAIAVLRDVEVLKMVELIFMDIHMPDFDGLELARTIKSIRGEDAPRMVFTTAYDQYAIEGYKLEVLDYLLKPFNYDDFLRVAHKAKLQIDRAAPGALPVEQDAIFFKVEYRWVKVLFADILYIEGVKDYVKVHLESAPPLITLNSLKNLESRLPASSFLRINRSTIVALPKITAVTKTSIQIDKTVINVGEHYRAVFDAFLQKWIDL